MAVQTEEQRRKTVQRGAAPNPLLAVGRQAISTVGNAATNIAAPAAVLAGGIAEPAAIGIDKIRGGIAAARGQELVNPYAAQASALAVRDAGVDVLASGLKKIGRSVPVGDTRPAAQPTGTPPTTVGQNAAPPNQPAANKGAVPGQTPTIAQLPQRSFNAANMPTEFKNGGFAQSLSGPNGREEGQRFLAQRQRDRDANLARRDAQIDASIANANQQSVRNQLISEFNRTPSGGGIQRQGEFRPRGGGDPRLALAQQISELGKPITPAATPSATQQQKDTAELDAAAAKAKTDAVQTEAAKLAVQGATRKDKIQQQITELGAETPQAASLRSTLAALDGKDPNADRFQSIEEIVGTDQFGTPIKVRSLYDTRSGSFVNRPGQQAAAPTKDQATAEAKQAVKNGASKDAVNARLKEMGFPTI